MSQSSWDEGSDSDQVTGLWDYRLVGHRKILAWQLAKLPRYWREGAVEVRPFPAKKRPCVSEAQGLSGEAMKGNPTTTAVIPQVDESKSGPRTTEDLTEPESRAYNRRWPLPRLATWTSDGFQNGTLQTEEIPQQPSIQNELR
jgi:hypothetical protein